MIIIYLFIESSEYNVIINSIYICLTNNHKVNWGSNITGILHISLGVVHLQMVWVINAKVDKYICLMITITMYRYMKHNSNKITMNYVCIFLNQYFFVNQVTTKQDNTPILLCSITLI